MAAAGPEGKGSPPPAPALIMTALWLLAWLSECSGWARRLRLWNGDLCRGMNGDHETVMEGVGVLAKGRVQVVGVGDCVSKALKPRD